MGAFNPGFTVSGIWIEQYHRREPTGRCGYFHEILYDVRACDQLVTCVTLSKPNGEEYSYLREKYPPKNAIRSEI